MRGLLKVPFEVVIAFDNFKVGERGWAPAVFIQKFHRYLKVLDGPRRDLPAQD